VLIGKQVDRRGLPLPSAGSFVSSGGMLRGLLMRRQSSQVSAASPMSPDEPEMPAGDEDTVYGPSGSGDVGDEIRFSVELTRIDRLADMYSLDIRRLKGNLRSYKFVYDTLRE
jgi:protein-serine/threonine kinase